VSRWEVFDTESQKGYAVFYPVDFPRVPLYRHKVLRVRYPVVDEMPVAALVSKTMRNRRTFADYLEEGRVDGTPGYLLLQFPEGSCTVSGIAGLQLKLLYIRKCIHDVLNGITGGLIVIPAVSCYGTDVPGRTAVFGKYHSRL